jgi:hypothetical protein
MSHILVWEEVTIPNTPPTPAGRSTRPPRVVNNPHWTDPGAQRYQQRATQTNAGAQMIMCGMRGLDYVLINETIDAALRAEEHQARRYLQGHGTGGILAEAHIIVRFDPGLAFGVYGQLPVRNFGLETRKLVGLHIYNRVYARPEHALSVRNSQRRRQSVIETGHHPKCEYHEWRFFWGHWK